MVSDYSGTLSVDLDEVISVLAEQLEWVTPVRTE